MEISGTKQKIFEAAIRAFNAHGIANVKLQQIANETGISVGNLAYHFKNKEAIVSFVFDELFDEFSDILSEYALVDNLSGFDQQLNLYFDFFKNYQFFLTDIFEIERCYADIISKWHNYANRMLMQIKARIDFDIQRGAIIPQSEEMNDLLANNIWMSVVFWLPQQALRGLPVQPKLFREAVWSQLIPYLTSFGQDEFVAKIYPALL